MRGVVVVVVTARQMAHMVVSYGLLLLEDFLRSGGSEIVTFGDRSFASRNDLIKCGFVVYCNFLMLLIRNEGFTAVLAGRPDSLSWCLVGCLYHVRLRWRLHLME